jgi:hypothetical protein
MNRWFFIGEDEQGNRQVGPGWRALFIGYITVGAVAVARIAFSIGRMLGAG